MSLWSRIWGRGRSPAYVRGITQFNRGEYGAAVASFEEVLREMRDGSNPDVELARFYSAEAHVKLGVALFRSGDYSRAQSELSRALEVEGSYPDLHYYLGVLAERQGRLQDARSHLERALELNPGYVNALAVHAIAAERSGQSDLVTRDLAALRDLGFPVSAESRTLVGELRVLLDQRAPDEGHGNPDRLEVGLDHRVS